MAKDNITRSPLVAVFMATSIGFSSPVGHDVIYQLMLRGWFSPQWIEAMRQTDRLMSFESFRNNDMIEFWVYDPNPDVFLNNMRLLNEDVSFCLPFVGNDKDQPDLPQNSFACHVITTREDKKDKKKLVPS